MESAAFFHGGHCRAGTTTTHFAPEKKADHFIVEDLLDFSNDEEEEDAGIDAVEGNSSTESSTVTAVNSFNSSSAGDNVASRTLADDLCEPYEELAELEWLSNFVEDSFSSEDFQKLHHFTGIKSTSYSAPDSESRGSLLTPSKPATTLRQEPPVPGKARSKRSRAAPSSWSSELLVLLPSPATFSESQLLVEAMAGKKTAKLEKKRDPGACRALAAAPDGRKCLHCATDKTPQWRTGPMGPKTLCNACGVRYKSGRLVPEYRPAASPTFVLSKHSNSHRKVLELRRQKELQQPQPHHFHAGAAIFDGVPSESGDIFLIRQQIGADFCD